MNRSAQQQADWRTMAWALLAAFAVIYLALLGFRPLMRLDEFRYAAAAQEMLISGDWITPHLNGLRYFEKPIFGYWTGAAALALFGENAFALRLTSALATGLVAVFIGLFMGRYAGARTGLLAAFVYLGCLFVYGIGTTNILDPLLNLWLTLALGFFFMAQTAAEAGRRGLLLAATGVFCGLAFLTKGFLAFAVPVVVATPFLVWGRHWRRLLTDPWPAIGAAFLVALPWALAINAREPDYWHYFFWVEHIQRFLSDDAQHGEPPWYFLLRFPALVFPWVFMVPAALIGLRQTKAADRPLLVYLLCWLLMPLLFFSASRGKLISYVLPCMPAFAMLTALGLQRLADPAHNAALRRGVAALALTYAAGALFLLLNGLGLAGKALYEADQTLRWIIGAAGFATGALACAAALRPAWRTATIGLAGASLAGVMIAVQFALPNSLLWSKSPGDFLAREASMTSPNAVLVADSALFRAVNWSFRRHDVYMLDEGELEYGLGYPDARYRLLAKPADRVTLIAANPQREIVFVTKDSREHFLVGQLPDTAHRSQWGEAVIWRIKPSAGR